MKKIEAKTETGVNYREYAQAVSEAKYTVNIFKESINDKDVLEQSISIIMERYALVVIIWTHKIKNVPIICPRDADLYNYITIAFPKLMEGAKKLGMYDCIECDVISQLLWKDASLELNEIAKLFK